MTAAAALVADVLARFGRVQIRALGTSMMPTIQSGDILDVEACADRQLSAGDVVLVAGPTGLRAHRIVAVRRQGGQGFVVTRGDALWSADGPEPVANVIARVVGVTRKRSSSAVSADCFNFDRLRGLARSESARIRVAIRRVLDHATRRTDFNAREAAGPHCTRR